LFGASGVAIATLVMTALVLIFSEVTPKTYAITNPDRAALLVAPVVSVVVAVFGPVVWAVERIVRGLLAVFGIRIEAGPAVLSAHEDLRGAVDLLHRDGAVVKADRDMLGGLLDLRELEVSDVMVHRTSMKALNADEPPAAIVKAVLASPHTRLPVWRGESDD